MSVKVVKNPLWKNVATAAALVGFVGGVYVYTYSKMKTVRSSTALDPDAPERHLSSNPSAPVGSLMLNCAERDCGCGQGAGRVSREPQAD